MSQHLGSLLVVLCVVAAVVGFRNYLARPAQDPVAPTSVVPSPVAATRTPFEAGQVWRYHTRQGEEKSRLTVIRVESLRGQDMVHVALSDLTMLSLGGEPATHCSHLPFSEAAVRESVVELDRVSSEENPMDGYDDWRKAFETGEAGIFTCSVAAALDGMAEASSHGSQER